MLQPYEILFSDIIEVDEPIDPKYLSLLVQTHFKVNKPFKYLHAFYLQGVNVYCVIASNDSLKHFITEPQILEKKINNLGYTLCITPYYYALFYEKKFIYIHKFQKNIQVEDVKLYLIQKLALDQLDILVIDEKEYHELKKDISTILPMQTLTSSKSIKFFAYYFSYVAIVFFLTFFYINQTPKVNVVNTYSVKDISNNHYVTPILLKILNSLQKEEVYLEDFSCKNQMIIMKIKSKKINNIYSLVQIIHQDANIRYIHYDQNSMIYYSQIEFANV